MNTAPARTPADPAVVAWVTQRLQFETWLGQVRSVQPGDEGAPVAAGCAARVLVVLRSAGCCNSRIAFGLIGFMVPPAGKPAPFAVGAVTPRANPSDSHSFVTATQLPVVLRYSTRSQPSIRFQADEFAVMLYGVKALDTTGRPGFGNA